MGAFTFMFDEGEQSLFGGDGIPGQVFLGCIRNQVEQSMDCEPLIGVPPFSLLQILPDFSQ